MGLFDAIGIAGSGLTAERIRMDVTAENLANADTTKAANGQPYQRQDVELAQVGSSDFGGALTSAMQQGDRSEIGQQPGGVQVTGIISDNTPDQQVYDPGNPEADARGYVKMPNVSTVTEMTDLISESQSYQSDVTAMQTAKSMFTSTLQVLK
ncbi:MAG TPA: flagellar basal body rod protein FlgC [Solirubrobacteraceae bacterium]|jgi:flagellar basal-body rod protein FlgC|nr:flagellar basal body rod protein FlgC [Solirubrobacteraceae bacterium]